MIVVFISSPYTIGDTAVNVRRQIDTAKELMDLGYCPILPLLSHFEHLVHPRPYKDDEKHVHPLQLDIIDRVVTLRSNIGETVLTPFMGVGSEVFSAVHLKRNAIGIELKKSYYKQSVRNMQTCK